VSVVQQAYVCGVSTRRVDRLVASLGLRISKERASSPQPFAQIAVRRWWAAARSTPSPCCRLTWSAAGAPVASHATRREPAMIVRSPFSEPSIPEQELSVFVLATLTGTPTGRP